MALNSNEPKALNYESDAEWIKLNDSKLALSTKENNSLLIAELNEQLAQIRHSLNEVSMGAMITKRIDILKAEQTTLAEKLDVAHTNLGEFKAYIEERNNWVQAEINKNFDTVKVVLFDEKLNGEIHDACIVLVNGVPFADVNNAGKINAGIEIINALSQAIGITMPIFIDNAESITSIRETQSQTIELYVDSEHKSLKIN